MKETQDFAVSLVTNEGEIFAYPYGSGATPIMGVPMHAGTKAFDDWQPGDIMMTNDPYSTGGMVMHLNDIYLFKPIFVDGRLLCFAWTFIHCTDVGGYAPGSIDMRNNEVFQEGLRLRPVKLMRQGALNQELWNIFADNCRIPALNWGDITACIAALDKVRAAAWLGWSNATATRPCSRQSVPRSTARNSSPARCWRASRRANTASTSISRTTTSVTFRFASPRS